MPNHQFSGGLDRDRSGDEGTPQSFASREQAQLRQLALLATQDSLRSAQRLLDVEQILACSQARVAALEGALQARGEQLEQTRQRLERADRVTVAMKASFSWRLTAALRAFKRMRRSSGTRNARA